MWLLIASCIQRIVFNEYKSCISSGNCSIKTSPALVSDTPLLLLSKSGVPTHSSKDCILRLNAGCVTYLAADAFEKFNVSFSATQSSSHVSSVMPILHKPQPYLHWMSFNSTSSIIHTTFSRGNFGKG